MGRAFACFVVVLFLFALPVFAGTSESIDIRGKQQTLYLYGTPGSTPIILSSGDLGWAGLVTHLAEFLSENGYFVIGFNSRSYLASFTTKTSALSPKDVPSDFKVLVTFGRKFSSLKPILSGVSEGAGLSVLAATDLTVKKEIAGVLCFGLPDQNELGWKWQDFTIWITKKNPAEPSFMVEDIITQVGPVPLAEIHSSHDEFLPLEKAKAMFALAREPKKMWVVESANHRFSNNRRDLDRCIIEALSWIKSANK